MARTIYTGLVRNGKVARASLGVHVQRLTARLAAAFGLKHTRGLLIPGVPANGTRADAQLRIGDVLLSLDGRQLSVPYEPRTGPPRRGARADGRDRRVARQTRAHEPPPSDRYAGKAGARTRIHDVFSDRPLGHASSQTSFRSRGNWAWMSSASPGESWALSAAKTPIVRNRASRIDDRPASRLTRSYNSFLCSLTC